MKGLQSMIHQLFELIEEYILLFCRPVFQLDEQDNEFFKEMWT